MNVSVFHPDFKDLPGTLPVFPLTGVLLLPGGTLPLNIFEPRYIAMIDQAMAQGRMLGMVQPQQPNGQDNHGRDAANDDEDPSVTTPHPDHGPALYDTGCMGRIIQFEETEDGRYIIMLEGLSRFRIEQELPLDPRGFRQVKTDWSAFKSDLDSLADDPSALLDRARLMPSLKQFFNLHGLSADWEAIERTPDDRLITTLCMICPFEPGEKQALLEAPDIAARADIMQALFDMAVHENDDAGGIRH